MPAVYVICVPCVLQDNLLMAYQIGFDLYESATQQFLQRVQAALRAVAPIPLPGKIVTAHSSLPKEDEAKKEAEGER